MNEFLKSKEFEDMWQKNFLGQPQWQHDLAKELFLSSIKEAYLKGLEAAKGAVPTRTEGNSTGHFPTSSMPYTFAKGRNAFRFETLSNIQKLIEDV